MPALFHGPVIDDSGGVVATGVVKRAYYKVLRVVHPDKATARTNDVQEQLVCRYVFIALKASYDASVGAV
jgi:hypothetical protein